MRKALLLLLFCNQLSSVLFAQKHQIKFEHLSIKEGLSQSNVRSIVQDNLGFMWFATRDGLNKYDGYKFIKYRSDPSTKNSLSHNTIYDIATDRGGNIWIGTWSGGLNKFDPSTNQFTVYKHNANNINSIANDLINCVTVDANGNVWIGTEDRGLDMFDPKTQKFTHYRHDKNDPSSISDDDIIEIFEDSDRNLWVGTFHGGLNLLDRKTGKFTHYQHDENNSTSIASNIAWSIFEDHNKNLWIGTHEKGLDLFNKSTRTFKHFRKEPHNPNSLAHDVVSCIEEDNNGNLWIGTENGGLSIFNYQTGIFNNYQQDDIDQNGLSNNSIYSLFKDAKGNMWVGTFNGGINLVNEDASKFIHYKHKSQPNSLSDNNVMCIYEDSDKNIWVATDGGGLNLFDYKTRNFTVFKHQEGNPNSIAGNYALATTEDGNGNLWIGTWGAGITVFNKRKNTYKHYRHDPDNPASLISDNIWVIYTDSKKNIWIGSHSEGLELYDAKHDKFIHYVNDVNDPTSISSNNIYKIFEDSKGNIWVGTDGGGLNLFNPATQNFTHIKHEDNKNSLVSNSINCIHEDKRGNFWITTDAGLNFWDRKKNIYKCFTTKDGLPNNVLFGILEDEKENLWISTFKGITKFNPFTSTFTNYGIADGVQSEEFKRQACLKSSWGWMYFGGINGFNEFHPDNIKEKPYEPPLVLTDFQIANKQVPISDDKDAILTKHISLTHALTLSHKESVIALEFASLNYTDLEKKQYAYMLEGFDKTWNYVGTRHDVTYTNLDPGNYKFKVKGLDNEGHWSAEHIVLAITVTPPYWKTWWFITLMIISVAGCVTGIFWIRISAVRKQKEELERQVQLRTEEERTARQEAERANQAKSVFLATMSHEIRTPMNGVIGMASLLAETTQTVEQQEYTETIRSCGESLLTVINDILDYSKIESSKMELEAKDFNLRNCIEEIVDVFADKAHKLGLDLIYEIDEYVPSHIIGDSLRLRQVIINLISNAIKFTPKGEIYLGVHVVSAENDAVKLKFEIRDTGIGIPTDKIDRLFKAFSQVDSSTTRKYGGSGLGLVICEKLVALMGGSIVVESTVKEGTKFSFTIQTRMSGLSVVHQNVPAISGKNVLVVDDNATSLGVLARQLRRWNLQVLQASNAVDALQILSNNHVDLLVSDMQMSGEDGVALAKQVKKQFKQTAIILLSAGADDRARDLKALDCVILGKPLRQSLLLTNIVNLFSTHVDERVVEKSSVKKLSADFASQYPLRILITEDNPVNQILAERVLTKLGYAPEKAFNGEEALNLLGTNQYDLILMDVQMPVMDGLEATKRIRLLDNDQPVIVAMTANAMQGDREICIAAGMNDYISKPIKLEDIVTILERWSA